MLEGKKQLVLCLAEKPLVAPSHHSQEIIVWKMAATDQTSFSKNKVGG